MTRTSVGRDFQSTSLGDHSGSTGSTTSAPTATTVTNTGAAWTTNQWTNHIVVMGGVFGVIVSNTATVLTIDRWTTPAAGGGSVGSTPGTGTYLIVPGGSPAYWIGVTSDSSAITGSETTLATEVTTGTLARAQATYAHTTGATSYTLTKTFTSDQTITLNKLAVFNASTSGTPFFVSAIPSPPALVSGDLVAITETVSI